MCLSAASRGLTGKEHGPYRAGIRERNAEQVFSPTPKSMIACQRGAEKTQRVYGSWLVPVAFVSELLKFCVCAAAA